MALPASGMAHRRHWPAALALGISLATGIGVFAIAHYAFPYGAFDPDSAAYLFQAMLFAHGHLAAVAPPDFGFSPSPHINILNGLWYAKYPFGNSLYIALGVLAGDPLLAPAIATGLTLFLLFLIVRALFDERTALVALVLAAVSPTTLAIGGSLLSQPTSRLAISFFLWSQLSALRQERFMGIIAFSGLAGAALGYAFNTRPLVAVVFGCAGAILSLIALYRDGDIGRFALTGASAVVTLAGTLGLFFIWNAYLTGDPLLPPYYALQQADRMGFGLRGEGYTPEVADFGMIFSPAMAFDRIWRHTLWAVLHNMEGWGNYIPNMLLFSDPAQRFPPGGWVLVLTAALVALPLLHRSRLVGDIFCGLIFLLTAASLLFQYSDHSTWGWSPLHVSYYNEATLFGLIPLAARGALTLFDWLKMFYGGRVIFCIVASLLLGETVQANIGFARGFRNWDPYYQVLPGLVKEARLANSVVFVPNSRNAPVGEYPFVPLDHAEVVYFRIGPMSQWRLDNPDWRVPYKQYFLDRQPYLFDGNELRALNTADLR